MDCHIEIFQDGQWMVAAEASFSDIVRNGFRANDCLFEYDLTYAFGNAPSPVSLVIPVDADRHVREAWPTFLYDLVPQGNGRKFLLDHLKLPDAQASDVPLLCAGAFNPIGRLRIREAVHYYEQHVERHDVAAEGFDFDELLARSADFHEVMMVHGMLATGGTGVQGVAPKYLLTEGQDGKWYPDAALADAVPDAGVRAFLLQSLRRDDDGWAWMSNLEVLRRDLGVIRSWPEVDGVYDGPVLWIAGGESRYVREEHRAAMEALFPRVRRATVKGAGHWVHSQEPAIVTELLTRFLAD